MGNRAVYTEQILLSLDPELLKQLDSFLEGKNRSKFIRDAIEEKLEEELNK